MHPLKTNFNSQLTKLLQEEWIFQRNLEKETLLHLQKYGSFPSTIDVCYNTSTVTTNDIEKVLKWEIYHHFPKSLRKSIINQNDYVSVK